VQYRLRQCLCRYRSPAIAIKLCLFSLQITISLIFFAISGWKVAVMAWDWIHNLSSQSGTYDLSAMAIPDENFFWSIIKINCLNSFILTTLRNDFKPDRFTMNTYKSIKLFSALRADRKAFSKLHIYKQNREFFLNRQTKFINIFIENEKRLFGLNIDLDWNFEMGR